MKKTRIIMYLIYILILVLTICIVYFAIKKSQRETDLLSPVVSAKVVGSSVLITATDNVGVQAYTYNTVDVAPNKWYKANNKKEFNTELKIRTEGTYYLWVKDINNNVSKSVAFSLNCKSGSFVGINNDVYCSYSSVNAYGYDWHVLDDRNGYITLFMDGDQLPKMNHCDTLPTTEFCYYVDNTNYDSYAWNKSIINRYLNKEFIKKLKGVTLKEVSVCSDRSGQQGCNDDDGCGGYLASDINDEGYFCQNQFVASKVRLLTLSEYNRMLIDLEDSDDVSWLFSNSNFWTMNAWRKPIYAGSIKKNGAFVVDEDTTNELDVRPVIVVKK